MKKKSAFESFIGRNGPYQVENGKGTDNSPQTLFYLCKLVWGEPVLFQIILFTSVLSLKFQRFTSCKCNFN